MTPVKQKKSGSSLPPLSNKKKLRDKRIAAMSIDRVPLEDQRATRAATQVLLARELHQAIAVCLSEGLLMPVASLLRSLIDTSVLGIWFVKYAPKDQIAESVADLSTAELIKHRFDDEDKKTFAFVFQRVKDTDHHFYSDVLHPSVHGDAIHLAMRTRDEASRKAWVFNCSFQADNVYCHLLLQFAKSGKVPDYMQEDVKADAAKCIRRQRALIEHPQWKGTEEYLSL